MRHTNATLLFSQGVNPKVVSVQLGHQQKNDIRYVYSHLLPSMQKKQLKS
ncbi:hypothetical protein ACWIE6_10715 [Paenibacillus taichungensis]